jgi:hypothetical protein
LEDYLEDLTEGPPSFMGGQYYGKGEIDVDYGNIMKSKGTEVDGKCEEFVVGRIVSKRDEWSGAE